MQYIVRSLLSFCWFGLMNVVIVVFYMHSVVLMNAKLLFFFRLNCIICDWNILNRILEISLTLFMEKFNNSSLLLNRHYLFIESASWIAQIYKISRVILTLTERKNIEFLP